MVHLLRPRAHFLNIKIRKRLSQAASVTLQTALEPQEVVRKTCAPFLLPASEPNALQASTVRLYTLTDNPEMYLFTHLSTWQ